MKINLTRSTSPRDRLESAHCTRAGVTLRDRHGATFISFDGQRTRTETGGHERPREAFADRQFTEGRQGKPLTTSLADALAHALTKK